MKKTPLAASLCLWTLALPCVADTFTLKDGTVLEASVLKEDPESYTLEVQITKSIKDERKVAKADVQKVDRAKPDLIAFVAIGKLVPTPDYLTEDEYTQKISAVTKFLDQNKGSSKVKDAKAILETLKTESAAVAAGGIKVNGKLVSAAEYQANAYDIDARIQEAKIRSLADAGEILAALRAFTDFDKEYRTTLSYGTLAPFMIEQIKGYVAEARQSLATLDARIKERQVGLQRMASADRQDTETAIKEETAAIEARYASEKSGKQSWPTMSPYHKASIDDTVRFGELELTRLVAVKTTLGVDGGKAFRDAYTAVQGGATAASISTALAAAKTALVPARYLAPLEEKAKAAAKKS